MTFAFPPSAVKLDRSIAWWRGEPITMEVLAKIVRLGESLPNEQGGIGSGPAANELLNKRNCRVSWIPFPSKDPSVRWLWDVLSTCIISLNEDHFKFDLWGFVEELQYTVYDGKEQQHYDWHVDEVDLGRPPRKLSFSLLLSDPTSFEGGELMISGRSHMVLPKEMGLLQVFPSYASHKVTRVTKGIRRSLVGWVTGRSFQ